MNKININELTEKTYDEGKEILLNAGYVQNDSAQDDNATGCDYILDTYFTLYDEEGEEIDAKSFVQHLNKNNDESNDDGSADIVVKEGWAQV